VASNTTLEQLADLLEQRSLEYGRLVPPGAVPPLAQIAAFVRRVATPEGTILLAQTLEQLPFKPGRSVESAIRRWAVRHVGPRDGEAFASIASALITDVREANGEMSRFRRARRPAEPQHRTPHHPTDVAPLEFGSNTERDEAMRGMRRDGASIRTIARHFGLSVARTHAVCAEMTS
jgi:hypothetical protein